MSVSLALALIVIAPLALGLLAITAQDIFYYFHLRRNARWRQNFMDDWRRERFGRRR